MKDKISIIAICILVLVILGIMMINPIKKEIYLMQFKEDVKDFLTENYKVIDSIEFSKEYNLRVDLNMNQEFVSLDFLEQKPIIKSISNDLKNIYTSYKYKVNKIDSVVKNEYGMIKFNINDYFYNTNFISNTIHKNGNTVQEYTEKIYLIERIKEKISLFEIKPMEKDYIERYLEGINDTEIYKNIIVLQDDDTVLLEIAYQYLLKLSNNNEYSEKIFYYKNKLSNYKDSDEIFNKIVEDEKNRQLEYFSIPRIGMTKQQVLNTTWGEPKYKAEDKPNTGMRYNEDGEEGFYYIRGTNRIMVNFKNGKVESFSVTKKGDWTARQVYSVEGY